VFHVPIRHALPLQIRSEFLKSTTQERFHLQIRYAQLLSSFLTNPICKWFEAGNSGGDGALLILRIRYAMRPYMPTNLGSLKPLVIMKVL
jgi:hypothetical protein